MYKRGKAITRVDPGFAGLQKTIQYQKLNDLLFSLYAQSYKKVSERFRDLRIDIALKKAI